MTKNVSRFSSNISSFTNAQQQDPGDDILTQKEIAANAASNRPDEIEYEKFCDECTFAPDLTSTKNRNVFTGPTRIYAKNVNKAVNRLRKGRLMRE